MATAPSSDITTTGWTLSAGAQAFDLVDEAVASDADYVTSPVLNGSQGPLVVGVASIAAGSHVVNVRARFTGTSGRLKASLLDGADVSQGESAWQFLSPAFADYAIPITTTGEAVRLRIDVDTLEGVISLDSGLLSLDGGILALATP